MVDTGVSTLVSRERAGGEHRVTAAMLSPVITGFSA